jgi:hypothetical protein
VTSLVTYTTGLGEGPRRAGISRRSTQIALHFQSKNVPFNEWLSQLTLCFAPFAGHLLTGIPSIVVLRKPEPPWYMRIGLFNPITIVWRYFIITDRRIRSRNWTPATMAASNAAFWNGSEWESSEKIMIQSEECLVKPPNMNRVSLMSISMIGTVIIAIQGVQAVYELGQQLTSRVALIQAIAGLFVPLGGKEYHLTFISWGIIVKADILASVASLFRLPAALWLSEEFGYKMLSRTPHHLQTPFTSTRGREYTELTSCDGTFSADRVEQKSMHESGRRYWAAILVRCAFLLAILGVILGFGLGHLIDGSKLTTTEFNASMLSIHFMYLVLCAAMFMLSTYYFLRGQGTETLIPCMQTLWYAVFTVFWYCLVVVAFVINALEMRRTVCGVYTTSPVNADLDTKLCAMVDNLPQI